MGGGGVSYGAALATNRAADSFAARTTPIIASGHGPLTTVGEEKIHNPFFPIRSQPPTLSASRLSFNPPICLKKSPLLELVAWAQTWPAGSKDEGFTVTAVFDRNTSAAAALAEELGCAAPATLPEVTAAADIIITVVTDDEAMDDIFGSVGCGSDSLLGTRERRGRGGRPALHQLRHGFARHA